MIKECACTCLPHSLAARDPADLVLLPPQTAPCLCASNNTYKANMYLIRNIIALHRSSINKPTKLFYASRGTRGFKNH